MQTQLESQAWLNQSHSHGVNLALKELMYYKAKAQLLELAPKVKIKNYLNWAISCTAQRSWNGICRSATLSTRRRHSLY